MTNIKQKLKKIKYQYLKKILKRGLSNSTPNNCRYNKNIKFPNGTVAYICSFDLDRLSDVDLCYLKEHSQECNAFCPKRNKEQLKEQFLKELADPNIRAVKYKDINILLWLYPTLLEDLEVIELTLLEKVKGLFSRLKRK